MTWERLRYNKQEINLAGRTLINLKSSDEEKDKAIDILDNWRAVHGYPMHIFQMTLKKKAMKVDKNALISQRLKRVPAIIYKLQRGYNGRSPSMQLYQMQDIGGCRAVLSDVKLTKELYERHYLKGDLKHKLVNKKDYIKEPKQDGYRSLHLIYEYKSDKNKKEFNGLLTEVQIRSRLQHLWATAVETAGFLTRQAIKSNEGGPEWIDFFRLISSAFAKIENCPIVPNTPEDKKELCTKIKNKERGLNFIEKMESWSSAMDYIEREIKPKTKKKTKFFLLELDIPGKKTIIKTYTDKQEEKAIEDYSALEKRHLGDKNYDIVLVGADNINDLKKAYPSYFLDIAEFLRYLNRIMYLHI
jgi:hypothetical protein